MTTNVKELLRELLALPPAERAALTEELLASLDRPDTKIDELGAKEAEDRLTAFENGQMKTFPAEEVFTEFEKP